MAGAAAYIDIARRKKEEQRNRIPKAWLLPEQFQPKADTRSVTGVIERCGVLTEQEISITRDHDATSLLEELRSGRLTSASVALAYCKRAALAHQLVNFTHAGGVSNDRRLNRVR